MSTDFATVQQFDPGTLLSLNRETSLQTTKDANMRCFIALLLIFTIHPISGQADDPTSFIVACPDAETAIIVDHQWKPHVWYDWGGHAILKRYAKLITGRDMPVVKSDAVGDARARDQYDFRIWIGRQPEVDRVLGRRLDGIDDDGFIIFCTGRDLYLSGKHWWGTNWAVYDLLERFAGCRWYLMEPRWWRPQDDGMIGPGHIVPKSAVIHVPADTNLVEEPDYKSRWFRIVPAHSFRVRQRDRFHHALGRILPPDKCYDSHPDFYPEIEGKRQRPKHNQDFQPCVTNSQVLAAVAEHIIDYFDEHPEANCFSIGMNDTNRFCECRQCMSVAPDEIKGKKARIAYAFFDFYNKVALRVSGKHADRRLGCLAYAGLRALPAGALKLHPMIVPYLTVDSAQLHDEAQVAEFRQSVDKWQQMSHRMGIYEYMYGGGFVIPRVYNRYLLPNIKSRYSAGADGFYAEAYPNWGLDGPKCWLVSKLLWDTSLDPGQLLDQFYGDMFGQVGPVCRTGPELRVDAAPPKTSRPAEGTYRLSPAAQVMKRYFEYLEETWCTQTLQSDRSNYRWLRDPRQLEIFTPEKCNRAWSLLEEAEHLATDETVRSRIQFFKDSFAVSRAVCTRYAFAQQADSHVQSDPDDLPGIIVRLNQWLNAGDLDQAVRDARKLGFSAFSTTGQDQLDQVKLFDRQPVLAVDHVTRRLVAEATEGKQILSASDVKQAVGERLAEVIRGIPDQDTAKAAGLIDEMATGRGIVFVADRDTAPTLDGQIHEQEWGPPIFSGRFFTYAHVKGRSASLLDHQADETTRIWAARHGQSLFLGFDMEQDPKTIGGQVTERDTTHWRDADMRNDDCIVLNFFRPRSSFQHVRINANGAISDFTGSHPEWNVAEARAGRTGNGWQVELRLDLTRLSIRPEADHLGPATMSIARYTRRADPEREGTFRAEATTLVPFPYIDAHIGHGNHPNLMVFRTGARPIFQAEPVKYTAPVRD